MGFQPGKTLGGASMGDAAGASGDLVPDDVPVLSNTLQALLSCWDWAGDGQNNACSRPSPSIRETEAQRDGTPFRAWVKWVSGHLLSLPHITLAVFWGRALGVGPWCYTVHSKHSCFRADRLPALGHSRHTQPPSTRHLLSSHSHSPCPRPLPL